MLATDQTRAEERQENADFIAAFNQTREGLVEEGVVLPADPPAAPAEPPAAPQQDPEPSPAAPQQDPQQPESQPQPQSQSQQALIAGLTTEQIHSALGTVSAQRATIDRLAGHVGRLKQELESLKAAGASPTLNLKLEKLEAQFPELAAILREDLAAAPVAATTAPTQADFDAAVRQGVQQVMSEQEDRVLNERMVHLEQIHPNWQTLVQTPQFALYRDHVLPPQVGASLMASQDVGYVSQHLAGFKNWLRQTGSGSPPPNGAPTTVPQPPAVPQAQPQPQPQSHAHTRLSRSVTPQRPSVAPATTAGHMSEEAEFEAAFHATRKGHGG